MAKSAQNTAQQPQKESTQKTSSELLHDRVRVSVQDHIAHVELARAEKMNALDPAMFAGIIAAGEKVRTMKGVRAVILSGEGRSFCAGLDVANFAANREGKRNSLLPRTHGNSNDFQYASTVWRQLPVPVIAAAWGVCYGGGLQIMSGADIRVVAPDARLAIMEMRWGLVPDMGAMPIWRSLVREDVLRELIYTNREFSGEEAEKLGLATYVSTEPLEKAWEIARTIAERNPSAMRATKDMVNRLADAAEDDVLLLESIYQEQMIGSANQMEAVMARMQKRAANFVDPD